MRAKQSLNLVMRLLVLALALCFAPQAFAKEAVAPKASAVAAPAEPNQIQQDPAVRTGTLPNGMQYSVRSNARPLKGLSMRLQIRAGSYEEADDKRGIAHFLEHMAFNGTKNFKEGELQPIFAKEGVSFGRDQNASTTMFDTTYELDFNVATPKSTVLGLKWLRDVADGMLLQQSAIDRERGVILAEYEQRLSPAYDWQQRLVQFFNPDLRSTSRNPIGTPETIGKINAGAMRAFYQKWYRPDLAAVVIVGDRPVAELERMVVQTFGSWKPTTPQPPTRAIGPALNTARPLSVKVFEEPKLPANISINWVRPYSQRGPDTVARRREDAVSAFWQTILNKRLEHRTVDPNISFNAVSVGEGPYYNEQIAFGISIVPRGDKWQPAMEQVLTEFRLMQRDGVLQSELDDVIEETRKANDARSAREGDLYSSQRVVNQLSVVPDERFESSTQTAPVERTRVFEAGLKGLTVADVNKAFAAETVGSGPIIAVTMPVVPEESVVRTAFMSAMSANLPANKAEIAKAEWGYTDFGAAGTVVKREIIAPLDFVRLTYANGLIVNFKNVNFTRDDVRVGITFGNGDHDIANADYLAGSFAETLMSAQGLKKHGILDLQKILNGRQVSASLSSNARSFVLGATTRPADLELQLQYLAATLTEPGFRNDAAPFIETFIDTLYRTKDSNPSFVLSEALGKAVAPNSPRNFPETRNDWRLSPEEFRRILEKPLKESPLELTVVGDVDEATTTALIAKTLGALPKRPTLRAPNTDTFYVRYPEKPLPEIRATHRGDPTQAITTMIWPLWVASPARRQEEYQMSLLSEVMDDRVRILVREKLGLSYAPSVSVSTPDFADQGFLAVNIITKADDAERVRDAIIGLRDELVKGPIKPRELEDVRKPILDAQADARRTNGWWFSSIEGSARNDQGLRDNLDFEAAIKRVTVPEMEAAARRWLSRPPIIAIVTPKEATVTKPSPSTEAASSPPAPSK